MPNKEVNKINRVIKKSTNREVNRSIDGFMDEKSST